MKNLLSLICILVSTIHIVAAGIAAHDERNKKIDLLEMYLGLCIEMKINIQDSLWLDQQSPLLHTTDFRKKMYAQELAYILQNPLMKQYQATMRAYIARNPHDPELRLWTDSAYAQFILLRDIKTTKKEKLQNKATYKRRKPCTNNY